MKINTKALTDSVRGYLVRAFVGLAIYFIGAITIIALVIKDLVLIPGGVAFVSVIGGIVAVGYHRSKSDS